MSLWRYEPHCLMPDNACAEDGESVHITASAREESPVTPEDTESSAAGSELNSVTIDSTKRMK